MLALPVGGRQGIGTEIDVLGPFLILIFRSDAPFEVVQWCGPMSLRCSEVLVSSVLNWHSAVRLGLPPAVVLINSDLECMPSQSRSQRFPLHKAVSFHLNPWCSCSMTWLSKVFRPCSRSLSPFLFYSSQQLEVDRIGGVGIIMLMLLLRKWHLQKLRSQS